MCVGEWVTQCFFKCVARPQEKKKPECERDLEAPYTLVRDVKLHFSPRGASAQRSALPLWLCPAHTLPPKLPKSNEARDEAEVRAMVDSSWWWRQWGWGWDSGMHRAGLSNRSRRLGCRDAVDDDMHT